MKLSFLKRLITRYRENKATPAERYILERWYDSFDQKEKPAAWLCDESARKDYEARVIASTLATGKMNRPAQWNTWLRAAAAILVVCSAAFLLYRLYGDRPTGHLGTQTAVEITTGPGQLKKALLPDSSEVFLNANSILIVPEGFGGTDRGVQLIGEAFFDVKPDSARPFTVRASDLEVRVLGTSFNVNAYENTHHIQVAVAEGHVGISDSDGLITELNPNDQLNYDKASGQVDLGRTSGDIRSWTTGRTLLDRASFIELAQAFETLYGLQLESEDPAVRNGRYNLTIRSDRPATQALEHLCTLIGRKYRKEGEERIIIY
ncbi:FecR family protein [Sphingobacterium sp. SGR-19]|uniref:FecR family protein n=1 Tax=Sphingobacterium sp. SGR-19 TaxID=2710886 RepID=UPI0013EC1EE7|nr:FecR domain-containing protein [Sphingobacterium sp. SGR-19]NGM64415.1 hypothetical protein [Sphingobacterium sp. SGR-19]